MASSFSDDEIKPGDPVMFTTNVSGKGQTRTIEPDETFTGYSAATDEYAITIEMYRQSDGIKIGEGNYKPSTTPGDGTLVVAPSGSQLYWPDNTQAYGFKATAGTETLDADQSTRAKYLLQDQLLGYAFVPLKDTENPSTLQYTVNDLNYKTSKQWKTANANFGVTGFDNQKKIPLYLKHQRSKITIILKEGEGVNHEDLALSTAATNIDATIYSYSGGSTTAVKPYASETTISEIKYTQYSAIVEPYDYQTNPDKDIARISISGQPFTFSVGNETADDKSKYYLTAGKHLIITATLARGDAQKVLLTAQVVPWTEVSTDATVGDDGLVGSTTDIDSRAGLLAFLSGENNKAGNIANITADIDLESGEAWTSQPLNCTMKLNNHTISTTHPVFTTIGALGKVEGGTISVSGDATVNAAVATTNLGTIKNVTVSRSSTGKASQGGLVVTNSGTISNCTSTLPVHGTSEVVGGIAKESVYSTIGSTIGSMPVIENCTVDARVDGETVTSGGGIVGSAVGRVSGNTFAYGITLNQNANNFKNIVLAKADSHKLRAYDNKWPTKADNSIGDHSSNNSNTTTATKYDATIDCSDELWSLLIVNSNNQDEKRYRVNSDFTVINDASSAHWDNNISVIYAKFHLDGNGKNITTVPTNLLLFANVRSSVSTNLYVNGELAYPTQ